LLRWAHLAHRQQLTLPDHVHEFDAGKCHRGRPEGFETQHRPQQPLDGSMVLFDDVVEVFDLTDLGARFLLGIVAFDRRRVGTTLVDRDLPRRAVPFDCLAQEPQRRFAIPLAVSRKSTVAPALSTARYRYFQAPLTRT
jgi:hypothetical protein